MNRTYSVLLFLLCFISVVLLSSFVILDLNVSPNPVTLKLFDFVTDHKVVTALAVSEVTGLLSKKVRGIAHGVIVASKFIFNFLINNRAKAPKS